MTALLTNDILGLVSKASELLIYWNGNYLREVLSSLRKNCTIETHVPKVDKEYVFAGYKVVVKGREKLSLEDTHQIQRVALLLNAYESFKQK
mgnify:CR=1 FL=1